MEWAARGLAVASNGAEENPGKKKFVLLIKSAHEDDVSPYQDDGFVCGCLVTIGAQCVLNFTMMNEAVNVVEFLLNTVGFPVLTAAQQLFGLFDPRHRFLQNLSAGLYLVPDAKYCR